jgi:hypothetical protein
MADVSREQLHNVVDELPSSELGTALRFLRFLACEASGLELIDAETSAELDAARAELGETVSIAEARRRLGL